MSNMKDPSKVITPEEVRFSFVHLMKAFAFEAGQEPKFSVRLLIPKDSKKTLAAITTALHNIMADPKTKNKIGNMPAKKALEKFLHDGDEDAERYPEQAGCFYINASNTRPVDVQQIISGSFCPVTDPTEMYSGCYGLASFNLFAYNSNGNKGVSCSLNNVVKTKDGDSLGGTSSKANDDFADMFPDAAAASAAEDADMNDLLNI